MALSARYIDSLKAKDKRYFSKRERGLCVRVEPTGHKAWYLIYDLQRTRTRYGFAEVTSEQGLSWARKNVEPMRTLLSQGICPKTHAEEQVKLQAQEQQRKVTFNRLIDIFKEQELPRRNLKSADEKLSILNKRFLPAWLDTEVQYISRSMVNDELDKIKAPSARKHALSHLHDLFSYACSRGIRDDNPAAHIRATVSKPRTRYLSDTEIRYFWLNIDNAMLRDDRAMNHNVRLILKLLLLCGQRRGEITSLKQANIEGDWIILPDTKNGQQQRVYLSSQAKSIIKAATSNAEFVFASGDGHVHPDSVSRQLREWIRHTDQQHYSVHDLRRTVGTGLAKLGVSRFDADRILNHVDSSVSATYDLHSYDKERRAGLVKWEAHIKRVCSAESSNVVSIN